LAVLEPDPDPPPSLEVFAAGSADEAIPEQNNAIFSVCKLRIKSISACIQKMRIFFKKKILKLNIVNSFL
jgi:hypothetical protein